jgi:beta-N-acetylhexosaminidase
MHDRSMEPLARTALRAAIVAAAVSLALVPNAAFGGAEAAPDPHLVAARATLARLTLADRASQLITTRVPGAVLDAATRRTLGALRPGGVILFGDNYRSHVQLRRLTRQVQAATLAGEATRPRSLLSIDQEGGVVKRVPDIAPTRSAPQLGAADRVGLTHQQGLETAHALVALGIPLNLAPVADLDLRPRHVMRERSFGSAPAKVARHVAAFVSGMRAGGGATAVKHFPGFGGASVNSDDALATITRTRAQLAADLLPFRSAVGAGTDAVMISHGVYAAIDRRRPASTSPAVYRLLRRDLGFDGVAITDSLHAEGFAAATHASIAEGCVRTIVAGADIALLTGSLRDAVACRAGIVAAVRSGRITRARLDEAATRVLRLKSRLGLLPTVSSPEQPAG